MQRLHTKRRGFPSSFSLAASIALLAILTAASCACLLAGSAWSAPGDEQADSSANESTITVKALYGDIEVTDQYGIIHEVASGSASSFEGAEPEFIRLKGSAEKEVEVRIETEDGITIEDPAVFGEGAWFRDVSFSGTDKSAIVGQPSEPSIALFASSTPSESQPEVGDVFKGKCNISNVSQNGTDGSVNYVICSPKSGILTSFPGITAYCADHSAAAPKVGQEFDYTYTITSVNKKTGQVRGSFYASSVSGSTDGVTTDSSGRLTGYQRVTVTVIISRDYTGYMRLKKVSTASSMTSSSSFYSLDGATYRIYDDRECTERSGYDDLVTKEGEYVKSEAIGAGTYYVKEVKASKGFELSNKVYKVEVVASETATVGIEVDGKTVVTETPRHNPSKFVLAKLDNENGQGWAQGDATLQGAQYKVEYYEGQYSTIDGARASGTLKTQWTFTSDSNGKINMSNEAYLVEGTLYKDNDGDVIFPLGTYVIYETQPSYGYLLSDEKILVQIIKDSASDETIFKGPVVKGSSIQGSGSTYSTYSNVIMMHEPPLKGSMRLEKSDITTGAIPQGDAELEGTTFEVRNASRNPILYGGRLVNPNELIDSLAIPANGTIVDLPIRSLPFGTYSVREVKAGTGYRISETNARIFTVTYDGQIYDMTGNAAFKNSPQTGLAIISKKDRETEDGSAQGDATLEGTEFQIENNSVNPISYKNSIIQPGEIVDTIETDASGSCPDVELPYGTYTIQETKASEGYLLTDTQPRKFSVRQDGQRLEFEFANDPIRGSLELEKRDLETGELSPIGCATLEGTRFDVTNLSKSKVVVSGNTYKQNEICATLYTNENGVASLAIRSLPYGTYAVQETKASEGYLLTDGEPRVFTIRQDGEIAFYGKGDNADKSKKGDAFYNQVMREDLELVKVRGDTGEHLAEIPFEITSKTTGERHVLVADENGEARTASSWNPHTRNTNFNDDAHEESFDKYAGVWWGTNANGTKSEANDDLCALPYDDYHFKELPVSANQRFELVEFDFSVKRNGYTIDLGTIENNPPAIIQTPSISTTASDATDGDKCAYASGKCKLNDQVTYMNLEVGQTYRLSASLLDAEDLQLVPNAEKSLEFTPEASFGSIVIEMECDTLCVAGRDVVFFEELSLGDETVCSHKDPDDAAQRVAIMKPEVVTYAHDSHDGDKTLVSDFDSYIVDDVKLENLEPNISYTLYGIIMDSRTHLPATTAVGESAISSTEDELRCYWDNLLSLLRADATITESGYFCDIAYSKKVDIPAIEKFLSENSDITDSIDIVSKQFTPTSASMTTSLDYPVSSDLPDGDFVIFDLLLHDDIVVAVHADTANADESFQIIQPKISTTAQDKTDKDHVILPSKEAKIIDSVEYEGLISGAEYEISGTLMDKDTGKALYINDKLVESTQTFIPNSDSGCVEVCFSFDASELDEGSVLVAFERLNKDGKMVAEHADIDSKSQTVSLNSITPGGTVPGNYIPDGGTYYKTGYIPKHTPLAAFAFLSIACASYLAILARRKYCWAPNSRAMHDKHKWARIPNLNATHIKRKWLGIPNLNAALSRHMQTFMRDARVALSKSKWRFAFVAREMLSRYKWRFAISARAMLNRYKWRFATVANAAVSKCKNILKIR